MQTTPPSAPPAHHSRTPGPVRETLNWALTYGREGAAVVVGVHGELDLATADDLRSGLIEVIERQGASKVIIDLRGLEFIGATGLAVLVEAQRRLRRLGGALVLADPPPIARRVLELTGLHRAFQVRSYRAAVADARGV